MTIEVCLVILNAVEAREENASCRIKDKIINYKMIIKLWMTHPTCDDGVATSQRHAVMFPSIARDVTCISIAAGQPWASQQ